MKSALISLSVLSFLMMTSDASPPNSSAIVGGGVSSKQISKTTARYSIVNDSLYEKVRNIASQVPFVGYLDGSDPNILDEYKNLGSCEILNAGIKGRGKDTEINGFYCKLYGSRSQASGSLKPSMKFLLLVSSIKKVNLEVEVKIIGWYNSPSEINEVKSVLLKESTKLSPLTGDSEEMIFNLYKNSPDYGRVSNKNIFNRIEEVVKSSPKIEFTPNPSKEIAILSVSESIISPQVKKNKGEKLYRVALWDGVFQIDLCDDYTVQSKQVFLGYYKSDGLEADIVSIIKNIKPE